MAVTVESMVLLDGFGFLEVLARGWGLPGFFVVCLLPSGQATVLLPFQTAVFCCSILYSGTPLPPISADLLAVVSKESYA